MSIIKKKAEVFEEQRTVEALVPQKVDIPHYDSIFDIDLLVLKDGELLKKPAQGQYLWFDFEVHRAFPDKGEIVGFLRRIP